MPQIAVRKLRTPMPEEHAMPAKVALPTGTTGEHDETLLLAPDKPANVLTFIRLLCSAPPTLFA